MDEIEDLQNMIAEKNAQILELRRVLQPYDQRKRDIHSTILATLGPCGFQWQGGDIRRQAFAALDTLHEDYRPMLCELRTAKMDMNAAIRLMNHIRKAALGYRKRSPAEQMKLWQ